MLETPYLISELIAAQVGSQRTSTQAHVSVPNALPDPSYMPLCSDECFMVPETCSVSSSEMVSVQPRGSDTQRNGLSLESTVSLLMAASVSAAEMSNTQNAGTLTPIPSPTMSVTVDTSSISSDTKPGDDTFSLQQSSTSQSESPTVACDPQNISQLNITLTSTKLDSPTLEIPSSVQDSTIPFDDTLSSKMPNTSSDVSVLESRSQFHTITSTSSTLFPNTSDCPSSPEFLLKTSLNPVFSEIPSTGLMGEGTSAELSMEERFTKPSTFDNTPLTSPQDRLSSSTAPSEGTPSSATCYVSSV